MQGRSCSAGMRTPLAGGSAPIFSAVLAFGPAPARIGASKSVNSKRPLPYKHRFAAFLRGNGSRVWKNAALRRRRDGNRREIAEERAHFGARSCFCGFLSLWVCGPSGCGLTAGRSALSRRSFRAGGVFGHGSSRPSGPDAAAAFSGAADGAAVRSGTAAPGHPTPPLPSRR